MRPLAILVAALCLAAPAAAQPGGAPPADCESASSQVAMNACSAARHRQADSALNATYARAIAAAGPLRAPLLRGAQRAWVAFRDAHCRYDAATYAGGSAQGMLQTLCLTTLTRERERQLGDGMAAAAGAGMTEPADTLGAPGAGDAAARVTGTATYRERVALPPDAVLTVRLEDVARADARSVVVAEQTAVLGGRQVPIPFALAYDGRAVPAAARYVVRATIRESARAGGALLFTTTRAYPVVTQGSPRTAELLLERVQPSPPPPAAPAAAADPWQAARARGASFRAVGNEPGWTLEIVDGQSVTMVADYGERRVTTPAPAPTIDRTSGAQLYDIRTEAHRLTIRIERRPCADVMSGQPFASTVTAVLDGTIYRGCGRSLR